MEKAEVNACPRIRGHQKMVDLRSCSGCRTNGSLAKWKEHSVSEV